MAEEDDTRGHSQSNSNTTPLLTKEDVAKELKRWISTGSDVGSKNFYRKAIEDIESKLDRPLSCSELTWFQSQYVITLLQLWLEKSLGKAFEYLNDEVNDVSKLSTVLSQLNSINSFEDIQPNDVESTALFNWCDGNCRYLKLIREQEDLFKKTPRFTAFVKCYFKQFKISCIEKVFSQCLNDIVTDKTNGEIHGKFIEALNQFLSNVNEEKNLKDILDKDEFLLHYVKDENKTGRDIIKQLAAILSNSTETEQGRTSAEGPEWLQTFLTNVKSLSEEECWTPKLQWLTKETCKRFLLPETEIKFKEEDGKEIICITGVVIYISQMIEKMNGLKQLHPDVEEIKILALQSIHIDCNLNKDTWHGINIGINTDKLIVDDEVCWNVSGKSATINPSRGKPRERGESGGNVHVVCNQIINGEKWTIVSDGGDGSANYKWTEEEFKKSFPSMSTGDKKENMKTVLTTLREILPKENRTRGKDILPGHNGNFLVEGTTDDGSEITAIFYKENNIKGSLILIKRGHIGQGGYGGDITVECLSPMGSSSRTEIPFTGMDPRRNPLTNVQMGVYEASGSNGVTGKTTGDVAFIHKFRSDWKGTSNEQGISYGFDVDFDMEIEMNATYVKGKKKFLKYKDRDEEPEYAGINHKKMRKSNGISVKIVEAIKKKAVIRRGLVQHLDQIDEWNHLTIFIQKMLSKPTKHRSSSIDEIINEMENKVHEFHYLMSQRQQTQINQQYVKPAIDSSSRSLAKPKIIGRRPVDSTQSDVCCLDILSAENGVDSLFHCLFGKINPDGKYICKNTNQIRLKIARKFSTAFHREKGNTKPNDDDGSQQKISSYNFIGNFASRVQDYKRSPRANDKIKENIQRVVDEYSPHDDEDFLDANDDEKWKNAWNCIQNENDLYKTYIFFKQQYAKFIESPTSTMGLAELQILAEILDITIHVYKNGQGSFHHRKTLKKKESEHEYFILYEGNGQWQKLEPSNKNLQLFCRKNTLSLTPSPNRNESTYFNQLRSWIDGNQTITINRDAVNSQRIDKFNPQNQKTPDELSRLILERFNKPNDMDDDKRKQLVKAIASLSEWVDYYNNRNTSPFFYLTIVEKYEPHQWKCEFLLLEMETRLGKPWKDEEERNKWRKEMRQRFISHDRVLQLLTKITMKSEETLNSEKLLRIFDKESDLKDDFSQSSLIALFYKVRTQFWEEKVDEFIKTDEQLKEENKSDYVNLFLEMEYTNQIESLQKVIHNTERAMKCLLLPAEEISEAQSINMDKIIALMKKRVDSESKSGDFLDNIKISLNQSNSKRPELQKDFESIKKESIDKKSKMKKLIENNLENFLCLFDYAVELTKRFKLRDTQRVAIMTLLADGGKKLAQVSTGEGKSIIVAGVAIGLALIKNYKIDVITSNDVLAIRDSSLPVAEGGLKELYKFFNVTVSNNCNQSTEDRKIAYNMDVVYGQLANFQRDYLLDKFYDRNIRGDRPMDFVIIDEADCMLLDRGNNVLYLSHDIPGMEMLESLYVFIWEKIQTDKTDKEIKSTILYDLYGQITKENLNSIHAPLGEKKLESERSEMWEHLIDKKVINQQGRLLINDVNEITEEMNDYEPKNEAVKEKKINSKIVFYLRTIIKRKRHIRIPHHLLNFVDRHLDTWLDNARRALELKQDEDYVIDQNRSDTNPDLNPQVIIIDPETGTDQFNSQWDGALHQFLQLKERCKLTLQRPKAVFISNAKYMNEYQNLVGVSGTLGSEPEQTFLKNIYKCDLYFVPTAFPKRFSRKTPKLFKTTECWRKAIIEETRQTIIDENRSIVIFCRSIKEVSQVHQHLKSKIPDLIRDANNKRIHRYTRDYEKFQFEKEPGLDVGNVIVTTNLAGRGTDIKLSPTLISNGGLHICLTYFPENERVEDQAMGRAARKGEPGSGILILCEESGISEEWDEEKIFVMKEERAWKEWQRITQLEKDFNYLGMLGNVSEESTDLISKKKIKKEISDEENNEIVKLVQQLNDIELINVIHDHVLDKWAMWLDETDFLLKCYNLRRQFDIGLKKSITGMPECMTPARRVTLAKHLAMKKSNKKRNEINPKAIAIFNEIIHSTDHFFYPAAFYYHAFILLNRSDLEKDEFKKEKEEFIRTLRSAETILNEHIEIQDIFFSLYQSERSRSSDPSFYRVNGYQEQKQNNIKILECFISSIQSILGTHYLSPCDIEEKLAQLKQIKDEAERNKLEKGQSQHKKEDTEKSKELIKREINQKADKLFKWLMDSKYIECAVNDPDTVPNYSDVIRKIANKYNVKRSYLEEKIMTFSEKVQNSGKDIEKQLEKENLISCSKETFWTKLTSKNGPLIDVEDIIVMDDSECDDGTKLDRSEKVTIDGYVQYEPKYFSQLDLEDNKKIMFTKEYVIDTLPAEEYRKRKPKFKFNKIAKINFEKLKTVDLKAFGQLTKDHLRYADFNPVERQVIWNELKQQRIIDDQGYYNPLAPDFKYSDCPIYEVTVNWLIVETFPAEFVRRKWLEMESKDKTYDEYFDCIKSINLLFEKPYCEMLGELMASHVISVARVADDIQFDLEFDMEFDVKKKLKEIINDKDERNCIKDFLKERQADYVVTTTGNVTLEFLEGEIETRNDMRNISSEFHVFRLIGFDCIISIKNQEKTKKAKAKATAISLWGSLQFTAGVAMNLIPLGIANSLIGDLTKTGLDDIYFGIAAFKSPTDLMLYYKRRKTKSLKESGGLLCLGTSFAQHFLGI